MSTTTSSKTTVLSSTTTHKVTSMPKVSALTAAGATTSTWTTPTITPPSALQNPNVWKSDKPSGLVFIAVGAVAGFIAVCILAFLLIRRCIAQRDAKRTLSLSDSDASSFSVSGNTSTEKLSNPFYHSNTTNPNRTSTKIPLLYENNLVNNSLSDLSDIHTRPTEKMYSTLDAADNNKRRSMFVSPTAEVMNLQRQQNYHQRMVSSISNFGGTPEGSNYSGPSRNFHDRSQSDIDNNPLIAVTSPEKAGSPSRGPNRAHKTVPSMYLESMFEDA